MLPRNSKELATMVDALERIDLAPDTPTALQRRQADLARLLNVSRTTANHIFHGAQGISKNNALQLSGFFAIDVDVFLT